MSYLDANTAPVAFGGGGGGGSGGGGGTPSCCGSCTKDFLGDVSNLAPTLYSFSSVSQYLLFVLLLSKIKPFAWTLFTYL